MVSRCDHSSSRGQVLGLNTESLVCLKPCSIMMIGVKTVDWEVWKKPFIRRFHCLVLFLELKFLIEKTSLPRYKDEAFKRLSLLLIKWVSYQLFHCPQCQNLLNKILLVLRAQHLLSTQHTEWIEWMTTQPHVCVLKLHSSGRILLRKRKKRCISARLHIQSSRVHVLPKLDGRLEES